MLGNAPTRMAVCAKLETAEQAARSNPARRRLFTFVASDDHGQHTSFFFLLGRTPAFGGTRGCTGDQVRERSVIQNVRHRIAHVEEDLIERAVREIAVDEYAELFGVGERGQRAIDQTHDLAEADFGWIAAELVASLGSAHAL